MRVPSLLRPKGLFIWVKLSMSSREREEFKVGFGVMLLL